jgi:sigma-E factor negative regulatory protein RseB
VAILFLATLLPIVLAVPRAARAAESRGPVEDPTLLLTHIQQAARKLDYAGVFMYQQGELLQSLRLVHLADYKGEGERERLEVLDGQPRGYLRANGDTLCSVSDRKTVLLERCSRERFPGILLGDPKALAQHYNIRVEPSLSRVADRPCRLIIIEPKDKFRYGYRLCADVDTHLLLKAQTLSTGGSVVEQTAFISVHLNNEVDADMLTSQEVTHDWKTLEATSMKPVDLAAQGWQISAPPGFVPVMQVTRTIRQGIAVNQLILSDGLAVLSVFIEPYKNQRSYGQKRSPVRRGASNIYGARIANSWLTVVGEVPAATLQWVTQSAKFVPTAANKLN